MRDVFQPVSRLWASSTCNVLVTGETGTGKELVCQAIHYTDATRLGPIVAVSCAALPEPLLESELFGHEKGAFTGADRQKKGRFELAQGGTLLLDEIGEIPVGMQAKLLRVLQDGSFERVGGSELIRTDCRIIAATNLNLADAVAAGRFREDLYYRLNVVTIALPRSANAASRTCRCWSTTSSSPRASGVSREGDRPRRPGEAGPGTTGRGTSASWSTSSSRWS